MSDLISKRELYHKLGEAYQKGYLSWGANEIIKDIIGECNSVENKGEPCDDCISRKDAIQALKADGLEGLCRSLGVYPWNVIKMIPSVQPTVSVSENPNKCGDLISRQAVLDELEKWDWQDLYLPIHFKQILDDVPSVENKGEWIYQQGLAPYKWRCNKCEKMFKTDFNYCPNCGADMRGK